MGEFLDLFATGSLHNRLADLVGDVLTAFPVFSERLLE